MLSFSDAFLRKRSIFILSERQSIAAYVSLLIMDENDIQHWFERIFDKTVLKCVHLVPSGRKGLKLTITPNEKVFSFYMHESSIAMKLRHSGF